MEKEVFFSGYCRQIDGARTVFVVVDDGELAEVDCSYETCPHATDCLIGKNIKELAEN